MLLALSNLSNLSNLFPAFGEASARGPMPNRESGPSRFFRLRRCTRARDA
jgi:hypothetical protein